MTSVAHRPISSSCPCTQRNAQIKTAGFKNWNIAGHRFNRGSVWSLDCPAMKRLTVFIPDRRRLHHWSRSEWDLELLVFCTKCQRPCQPREPWWWATISGEEKRQRLGVSRAFPRRRIPRGWIFLSEASIYSERELIGQLFNDVFWVFSLMFVAGRGGDHAYWPPDSNLIDRSSINGESQRRLPPLGCVPRTPRQLSGSLLKADTVMMQPSHGSLPCFACVRACAGKSKSSIIRLSQWRAVCERRPRLNCR